MLRLDCQLPILSQEDVQLDRLAQQTRIGPLEVRSSSEMTESSSATSAEQPPGWDPREGESFGTELRHLEWIDQFVANVKPYVRVRLEDAVLIKMPMEVFQINRTGLALLDRAMSGESIREIARSVGAREHPERVRQIHTFFCDVRDLLSSHIGDGRGRPTTHVDRFEGSFTRYPVLSEVAVTYRCNLACTFCYAGCGTADATPGNAQAEKYRSRWKFWRDTTARRRCRCKRDPVQNEMTAAEVLRVIDQIAIDGKVPSVSFTGGECTLRPELPDFIAHARRRGMRVNIITNGVICSSRTYVEQLVAAGLTSAQVSLEGPDAAHHDALTQRPGSFAKTVRGIGNLRDQGLYVHTNTTICEENAEHLEQLIDLAKSLDLPHVSMNQIIPTGTPNLARHERLKISYSRIGEYVMRAKRHADQVGLQFHWYSPTPFCIFNPVAHGLGNKGCAACDGLVHISPSGEMLPCSSFARGVGNVLKEGFEQVWFGKDAQYYRKKQQAHPLCRACGHFPLCQGACTLYWSGMGYRELYAATTRRAARTIGQLFGS